MNKAIMIASTVIFTGLLVSACSQQVQNEPMAAVAPAPVGTAHTHPANKCTNSVSHTHPSGGKAHKHNYVCKNNAAAAGAHTHPANRCTRTVSHAHPNGKRVHAHRYSCKNNSRGNTGNGHAHKANSMTRSTRHIHPNGARKHSHHYGR